MADDFYALLEVPRDASQDEIKTAFRKKVREYHPDHNDDPRANAQFTAVKKAYDTLGDPVERNAYDRMGHIDYVAKRLSGLPDPEKWAPDAGEDGSTASGSAGSSSGGGRASTSAGGTTTGTPSGSAAGGSGSTASTSTSSGGRSAGTTGSTSTGTASSSSAGSAESTSSSAQRTASDGAGAVASGRSVAYADDPIVDFVARHNWVRKAVGWPLLYFVMAIYAAGVGAVVAANADAFGSLSDRIGAAGTDTDALSAAFEREGVPIVYDATIGEFVAGSTPEPTVAAGTVLLALGAVVLPTVVFLLVYLTRLSAGWKPTYLYPVAVLGPLAGLAAGAAIEVPLAAELALFGLLPFGALLVMVLSAFVRPKLKAALFS